MKRSLKVLLVIGMIGLLALGLFGCGANGNNDNKIPVETDFTLQDLDGKDVSLSDYHGKKVLLVFWSTGCGWCLKELPLLNELSDKKLKDVVILAACTSSDKDAIKKVIKEKIGSNKFVIIQDSEGKISNKYNVSGFPTNIFIDRQGKESSRIGGYDENIDSYIKKLNDIL